MTDPNQNSLDPQMLTQQIASSYVDDYMPPVTTATSAPAPVVQATPTPPPAPPAVVEPVMPPMVKEEVKADKPIEDIVIPAEPEQVTWLPEEKTPPVQSAPDSTKPGSSMPPQTLKPTTPTEDRANTPDATPVAEAPKAEVPKIELHEEPRDVKPAAATPAAPKAEVKTEKADDEQSLESQNIFTMLGIESAEEKEKDQFLDELQQIIWEDFLNNDVELLLTEEEEVEFKSIQDKEGVSQEDAQTQMVEYLEKLVPDLEKIMLEKALELKEDMFLERIRQLSNQKGEDSAAMDKIEEAEKMAKDQRWLDATNTLNAVAH